MTNTSPTFDSPSPEELNHLITGYEIKELVSSGISGAIYEARQISLDRQVTIKVLPPEIGRNTSLRTAFESEAKTMARLNDPNLVDVFDFGSIDGMLFIIMENVPGRSLHETTHGSHVDQKESARLVADVCHGLDHAHQAGIIHRSLEPNNILINNEAQPKIVDFGLANLFADQPDQVQNAYTAPELLQPGADVDHRADIYSAGMILYELIVGRLPEEPYAPPSTVRNCRPELDDIIYKAIQPDPHQRYANAADMAQDLEEMLDKMGPPPTQEIIKTMMTSPVTGGARHTPIVRPAPPSSNAALIVTLLVVAVVAGIILLVIQSASEPADANSKKTSSEDPKSSSTPVPAAKPPQHQPKPPKKKPTPPARPKPEISEKRPTPKPTPPNEPEPEEEDKDVSKKDPEPVAKPEPPKPPEFDREEWLEKARAFMQKKGRSTLAEYDKALHKNLDRFERDVKRSLRKLDRNLRKPAQIQADEAFIKFREIGRLPDEPIKDTPDPVKKLYKGALRDQQKIDQQFLERFTRLRITYLQGIDKQTSILRKQGNDEHADALDEEISVTQKDMKRFIRILRGQDPDPEPEEDEKEDEKDK